MSKRLAIKGHVTRGKEVIEILETMGGSNPFSVNDGMVIGNKETNCYYISENTATKYISWDYIGPEEINKYEIFTLEEFLKKYPFKVGDKVVDCFGEVLTIKSMGWLDKLESMVYTFEESAVVLAAKDMKAANDNKLFGTVSKPVKTKSYTVGLKDGKVIDNSVDAAEFMQIGKTVAVCFNTENYENEVELKLGDYEIVVRDGKTYAVLKKPKYPKTYEECAEIMGVDLWNTLWGESATEYEEQTEGLINAFIKLKICRDAYWKIAGEEMGLGKPWNPNEDSMIVHYGIRPLLFPSKEIYNMFYDNFKDLIERCKELL